nr:peroxidase-like [Cherax quadricarinatus]
MSPPRMCQLTLAETPVKFIRVTDPTTGHCPSVQVHRSQCLLPWPTFTGSHIASNLVQTGSPNIPTFQASGGVVSKAVVEYSPPRTPAPTQPFIAHPGVGIRPQVTPVPLHLKPLQQPSYSYGAPQKKPKHGRECPSGLKCVPLVRCAPCYHQVENQPQLACSIYGGAVGVCCPELHNEENLRQLFTEPTIELPELGFNEFTINEALKVGVWELKERRMLEEVLRERDIEVTNTRDPAYHHLQFFRTSPLALELNEVAYVHNQAGYSLMTKFELSPLQAGYGLQQIDVTETRLANTCPRDPVCQERDTYYRRIDGACNNLENPMWGQARTTFQRLRPPYYRDGLAQPRVSQTGADLPSARLVSTSIVSDMDKPSLHFTVSMMEWGQFIDHDLTHTPINRLGNNSGIQCCSSDGRSFIQPPFVHPSCFPIEIPANDPFFGRSGRRCMNFVRSMFAPRNSPCTLGYSEQMNQVTHFLDGSNIYGSSVSEEQQLRAFRGGLLKVQESDLLPADVHVMECETIREGLPCFMAGDNRVNEQVALAVMHTVWVRIHNRIARELARLNPHWSDETLYQETRRIVVALYQHIIYNEWLPNVLGKDYMAANGLLPRRGGYSRDYDRSLNAVILNEFATVAFRFGHTLAQGMIQLVGKKGMSTGLLPLHENFNNPRQLYTPGRLDEFLRGIATQPVQMFDRFVTSELTNRLFETREVPAGMDLVALNTQRARDHGIAPYNDLREACGLPRARTFEDLLDVLPAEVVQAFSRLYSSVDDIDPFVAGISERQAPGSILGPTFRCIIGDQFTRLKRGDRFFYDLANMPSSFSEAQLHSIRMISWARIICEAGNMVGYVQPLAFRQPRGLNERVPCDSPAIPFLDLTPWISQA